jgi:hypothetical protein
MPVKSAFLDVMLILTPKPKKNAGATRTVSMNQELEGAITCERALAPLVHLMDHIEPEILWNSD